MAEGQAREPRVRLLAHWAPQLADSDIPWWIAREKIDVARRLRRVARRLGNSGGEHDVTVGVIDREHALRTDNPDPPDSTPTPAIRSAAPGRYSRHRSSRRSS
jgi:hypothetical protein